MQSIKKDVFEDDSEEEGLKIELKEAIKFLISHANTYDDKLSGLIYEVSMLDIKRISISLEITLKELFLKSCSYDKDNYEKSLYQVHLVIKSIAEMMKNCTNRQNKIHKAKFN